jgi:N-acetyl-gamma-glutamyl-phosphate reductase
MVKVGIVGAAGYAAGELIRILVNHPQAEIVFANSASNAGNLFSDVHEGLFGDTDMRFTDELPLDKIDVLFICLGHGKSAEFLGKHSVPAGVKIIDFAQDFRIAAPGNDYVYGLPETHRSLIAGAQHVANPGCFATCIQLALLPLAKAGALNGDVVINALTGSTGAGVKPQATTHFSWRNGNISVYKVFCHQHLLEINQSIKELQPDFAGELDFVPYRGDFARGIFTTVFMRTSLTQEEIDSCYAMYDDEPFTHYIQHDIDLKQVVNTNRALVHAQKYGDRLLVTSVIDNLLKGAAGQAVENMNIMFGLPETEGLKLKAAAF